MGTYEKELAGVGIGTTANVMAAIPMFAANPLVGAVMLGAALFGGFSGFGRARKRRKRYKAAKRAAHAHAATLHEGERERHGSAMGKVRGVSAQGNRGKQSTAIKSLTHKEKTKHGIMSKGIDHARDSTLNQLGEAYDDKAGMAGAAAAVGGAMNAMMSGVNQMYGDTVKTAVAPEPGFWSRNFGPQGSWSTGGGSNWVT